MGLGVTSWGGGGSFVKKNRLDPNNAKMFSDCTLILSGDMPENVGPLLSL